MHFKWPSHEAQRIVTSQFLWSTVVVFVFFTVTSFATKMDAISMQCWLFDAAISHLQCNKTGIWTAKGDKMLQCTSYMQFSFGEMLGCTRSPSGKWPMFVLQVKRRAHRFIKYFGHWNMVHFIFWRWNIQWTTSFRFQMNSNDIYLKHILLRMLLCK